MPGDKEKAIELAIPKILARARQLGLDFESEPYLHLGDLLQERLFDEASAELDDLEATHEAEEHDRMVDEAAQKMLQDKVEVEREGRKWAERLGIDPDTLRSTTETPPAEKTWYLSEVKAMSVQAYKKAFPTYTDFWNAQREGRVK